MGDWYEVSMDGGGPWGIRLQGGKDFGVPLNVARITPGSKASKKSLCAGDQIIAINNASTEDKTHMQAQNMIKSAGDELVLRLRQGSGSAPIASGVLAAQPKTLYQTEVTHSAAVDHKFNSKPKSFGSSTGSSTSVSHVSVPVKKFDPGEYARKKKEELEKYKEEKQPVVVDSDVLKMLQNTTCNDDNQSSTGLQKSLDTEEAQPVPAAPPVPVTVTPDKPAFAPPVPVTVTPDKPAFGMAAPNPYNLPIKAVVGEGGNPILDSLKVKMKEMNISAERLDRTSSVSSEDKGRYLSQSSRESAARPVTPTSPVVDSPVCAPKSPSFFRSSIKGGGNPTGVQGANVVIDSLKNRVHGDRMTLGLKQTRGVGASHRKFEESQGFKAREVDHNANTVSSDGMGEEL